MLATQMFKTTIMYQKKAVLVKLDNHIIKLM